MIQTRIVDIGEVATDPNNPRKDMGDLEAMAATFAANAERPGETAYRQYLKMLAALVADGYEPSESEQEISNLLQEYLDKLPDEADEDEPDDEDDDLEEGGGDE